MSRMVEIEEITEMEIWGIIIVILINEYSLLILSEYGKW
jgi:hypothetical protein